MSSYLPQHHGIDCLIEHSNCYLPTSLGSKSHLGQGETSFLGKEPIRSPTWTCSGPPFFSWITTETLLTIRYLLRLVTHPQGKRGCGHSLEGSLSFALTLLNGTMLTLPCPVESLGLEGGWKGSLQHKKGLNMHKLQFFKGSRQKKREKKKEVLNFGLCPKFLDPPPPSKIATLF